MPACAFICMVKNYEKHCKIIKKHLIHHAQERLILGLHRQMKKHFCWSEIGSGSQMLVDTQELVSPGFSWWFLLFLTLFSYFSTRAILLQNKHFSSCFIFWFNHGKSGNFISFTFATIYFRSGQFLWLALKINQFSYFWWCNSANGTHLLFIHFLHLPFTYETIIKICSSLLNTVWFFFVGI